MWRTRFYPIQRFTAGPVNAAFKGFAQRAFLLFADRRSSPQLARRRRYIAVTISALVSVRSLKCQFPWVGEAPI